MDNKPTEQQAKIAMLLGIDISHDSRTVASARIREVVEPAINPDGQYRPATERQIKFAESLGLEVSGDSFVVCAAKIADRLKELNKEALNKLRLKSGDKVRVTQTHKIGDTVYKDSREYKVSSVGKNGRVYFKGGAGASAWATQIERVLPESQIDMKQNAD